MGKSRARISDDALRRVLTESKRRCAFCYGLDGDYSEKSGQVAHIDRDSSNSKFSNLAWLCLDHHDQYDSRTSQSKGLTKLELIKYQQDLHREIEATPPNLQNSSDIPDFSDLSPEFRALLRFAPEYGLAAALQAIEHSFSLQRDGLLNPGVYYLVLADLVGSSAFMDIHGNTAGADRIEQFISAAIESIPVTQNTAVFLKDIGDAALMVFRHFPDVLTWHTALEAELEASDIKFRTVINLGEVVFDGANPLALAVSQLFKMEKSFSQGEIGLASHTFAVAAASLGDPHFRFQRLGEEVQLPGLADDTTLYVVDAHPPTQSAINAWGTANWDDVERSKTPMEDG